MGDYQPEPKYYPTDEEVRELLRLREQYWNHPLDAETMTTWTRRLKGMESRPGLLVQTIDAINDRGDKWPPHLAIIMGKHDELRIEAAKRDGARPRDQRPPPSSPKFRAAYEASALGHWSDEHERLVVLGAFNDEFGWPKDYPYIARVRQRVAEARALLEQAGRLEGVLERYRKLCEGSDEGEPAAVPGGDDDEIPF